MMLNGKVVAVETNHSKGWLRQLMWSREVPQIKGWETTRSLKRRLFSTSALQQSQYQYPICDISYAIIWTMLRCTTLLALGK